MNGVFIHQQVKALQNLGHQCSVLLTHNWFPSRGFHKFHPYWKEGYDLKSDYFSEAEGVPIHSVPVLVKMPDRIFKEDPYEREANAIVKYVKSNLSLKDTDWIISHFWTETSYIGLLVKEKLSIPLASFCRGDDIHEWPQNNQILFSHIRRVYEGADRLFANSQRLADDAQALVSSSAKKNVEVIYNGVDLEKFKPVSLEKKVKIKSEFGWHKDEIHLLCVATPVVLKGWLELLDGFKLLVNKFHNVKLVAVTVDRNFPDKIDLKSEALKRAVEEKIIHLGQIHHDQLPKIYQACDLFVLPSYNEGLANVALEAAACNLPMVLTDVGGHKEIFEYSNSVKLVPPKDTNSLLEAIEKQIQEISNVADSRICVQGNVGSYLQNAQKLIKFLV